MKKNNTAKNKKANNKQSQQNAAYNFYVLGYQAFKDRKVPKLCVEDCKNKSEMLSWLEGWSNSFTDFFDGFGP